ncbi:hypothetical protein [Citrobacter sp. JGM124]|uniref:hypothetical protein n=1 Tax=Citrobacter sp. JGM124 TaxID=2799789 RepID=UPI001BACECCB|nr:hypothetical protein [Citrobacter sp. JGM124]MBS0847128.1 hypothetical protein [Citrobacter sp. JGM124]
MKILIWVITWIFGIACGLSIASWMVANEKIADAVVFLYVTNGLALITFIALVYLVIKHRINLSRKA